MTRAEWWLLALTLATSSSVRAQGYRPNVSLQLTYPTVQGQLLARPVSVNNLLITEADPTGAGLVMVGSARFWWAPSAINGNAHCEWDNDFGISCSAALRIGAGAPFKTDSLYSRQGDRSVAVDQAEGLRLTPQSTLGTCDNTAASGHAREGDVKTLAATGTSRTRTCTCTASSNSSPTYAWALGGGSGAVGTSTTCPEVTP